MMYGGPSGINCGDIVGTRAGLGRDSGGLPTLCPSFNLNYYSCDAHILTVITGSAYVRHIWVNFYNDGKHSPILSLQRVDRQFIIHFEVQLEMGTTMYK